jgi:hypothetical protein
MKIKKKLCYIILMVLSFSNLYGQDENNTNRLLYKKNNVKSVKTFEYKYRNGKIKGHGKLLWNYLYDTTGLLTESYFYSGNEHHQKYKYNEKGNLVEEISYIISSPFFTNYFYKYDSKGNIIEKIISHNGGKWNYTYDSLGNQTKIKWLYMPETDPNSFFTDTFEYNSKNQKKKMQRNRGETAIYFYQTFDYDSSGNLIKEIRFENGDTTTMWTYFYDNKSNCIEVKGYDKRLNKTFTWHNSNYNDNKLITNQIGILSVEDKKKYYRKYVYEYY